MSVTAQRERLLDLLADRVLVGLDAVESEELGRLLVDFPDVEVLARDIELTAAAVALASFAKKPILALPEGLLGKIEADAQDGLPTTIHKLADLAAMAEEAMRDGVASPPTQLSPDAAASARPPPAAGSPPAAGAPPPAAAKAGAKPDLKQTVQMHQMPTLPTPITPQPLPIPKPTPAAGTPATPAPPEQPPQPQQQQQPPATITAQVRPFQSQPAFPASGPTTQAMPQQPQQPPQQQPQQQPPQQQQPAPQQQQPQSIQPPQPQQPQLPQHNQLHVQQGPGQVVPFPQHHSHERAVGPSRRRGGRFWVITGWLAAAACLALAVGTWWFRPRQEIVFMPGPPPPPLPPSAVPAPPTPTPAAERENLLVKAGTARIDWTKTKDATSKQASGDVVWNAAEQKGYMRFRGLAKNDKRAFVYQLWIFDKGREDKFPVDGGVFDVDDETGDVIVPIKAKLPVGEVALFAVTVEKPGGVVVSKRERIVVTAKPAT